MGESEKTKRLLCAGLVLVLAGMLPGGAQAAPLPGTQPGKTAVGVQTVDINPENLSFTVPLYLTVAAASDDAGAPRVVVPDGYLLRNTTGSTSEGLYPGIVVSKVDVQGVRGGTWSLKAAPQTDREIQLSIGGLVLPDVNAGDESQVSVATAATNNSFYDLGNKKYLPIPGGPDAEALVLPLAGSLWSGFTPSEVRAAAQFRIKYTVSLLDNEGNPVGISYEGPSLEDVQQSGPPPSNGAGQH